MPSNGLEHLEFPRLRELLTELAGTWPGRARLEGLRPFDDRDEAQTTLGRVVELKALADAGQGLPAMAVQDLGAVFTRLSREGGMLSPEEFLELGGLLRTTRRVREAMEPARPGHPGLWALVEPLRPVPHLERALDATFDPSSGDVLDTASSDLRRIRREREHLREKLRGRMERVASGLSTGESASVVTLREGRYVISVPQGMRGKVPGLVQDRSGTGATLYVEPLAAIDDNNALREKDAEEREEIRRILVDLTGAFARELSALQGNYTRIGELDALRARTRLAQRWGGETVRLTEDGTLRLRAARHPLLLEARGSAGSLEKAREAVVPLDVDLDAETRILLITGPNMGGKTVALKCVGLLSVMAQCGCPIPADPGGSLPWVENWVVDVGDEQSLAQDLSTFGAHLRRWAEALEDAGPRTLVLLDELGSGTDPTEGAALAQSVLEGLVEAGGLGLVTTHLGNLKGFAASAEGIQNASMVFDPDSRTPTYRLQVGIPGESHALAMARRLGFPPARVDRAEALLPREERDLRQLLADLSRERDALRQERREVEGRLGEAARLEGEARARLQRFLEERASLRARAARQAREILRRVEEDTRQYRKAGSRSAAPDRRKLAREQARLAGLETRPAPRAQGEIPERVRAGETYWAETLHRQVEVLRDGSRGERVMVAAGALRVELPVEALRTTDPGSTPGAGTVSSGTPRQATGIPVVEAPPTEVKLIGMRVEEAESVLDLALDRGLLAGLREVRVIHGHGTGALRRAVSELCKRHPGVKSFRSGEQSEGGAGATIVELQG